MLCNFSSSIPASGEQISVKDASARVGVDVDVMVGVGDNVCVEVGGIDGTGKVDVSVKAIVGASGLVHPVKPKRTIRINRVNRYELCRI